MSVPCFTFKYPRSAYRNLTRALLVLSINDLAMVEDHSPATVAVTHARRPTILLGEEGLRIAEEELYPVSYHYALNHTH